MQPGQVVVLDNGGCTCKVGIAGQQNPLYVPSAVLPGLVSVLHARCAYRVFPNCTARAKGVRQNLVGHQLLEKYDVSALRARRPCDRGYVVNWDLQREIWSHTFTSLLDISPATSGLLLAEPLFSLPAMQDATQQVTLLE